MEASGQTERFARRRRILRMKSEAAGREESSTAAGRSAVKVVPIPMRRDRAHYR